MIRKVKAVRDERANKKDAEANSGSSSPSGRHWPALAVGVAAASGLGLIAASLIGVGEVAIAGVVGYLAYRRMTGATTGESETERKTVETPSRKRARAA